MNRKSRFPIIGKTQIEFPFTPQIINGAAPGQPMGRIKFRSRDEADFASWCNQNHLQWVYEPCIIRGNGENWVPDFALQQIKTYIEIKPDKYWHETEKVKRVAADANAARFDSGKPGFWVWLVYFHFGEPIVGELTCPCDGEPEHKRMRIFVPSGRPADSFLTI
jgi:hypothetical protein